MRLRLEEYHKALNKVKEITVNSNRENDYTFIHYSCNNFRNNEEFKIYNIAVRDLIENKTVMSFSIYEEGDEKKMLEKFFKYIESIKKTTWIHWNMTSDYFGFNVLKNKAKQLGIPNSLDDHFKKEINLANLLIDIYTTKYTIGSEKQIELKEMNKKKFSRSIDNILSGKDELKKLEKEEYSAVISSTKNKTLFFYEVLKLVSDRNLKTKCSRYKCFIEIYDPFSSPQALFELAKDHWIVSFFLFIIGCVISAVIGNII